MESSQTQVEKAEKEGEILKKRKNNVEYKQLQTWQTLIQLYHYIKCEWCKYAN